MVEFKKGDRVVHVNGNGSILGTIVRIRAIVLVDNIQREFEYNIENLLPEPKKPGWVIHPDCRHENLLNRGCPPNTSNQRVCAECGRTFAPPRQPNIEYVKSNDAGPPVIVKDQYLGTEDRHTSKCCTIHGCEHEDPVNCSVVLGQKDRRGRCEECAFASSIDIHPSP